MQSLFCGLNMPKNLLNMANITMFFSCYLKKITINGWGYGMGSTIMVFYQHFWVLSLYGKNLVKRSQKKPVEQKRR